LRGILHIFLSKGYRKREKLQSTIIQYIIIATIIYISFYILAGFLSGFGKNSSGVGISGAIKYLWIYGVPIISIEWIRVNLVRNVKGNKKTIIYLIISLILFIAEINVFILARSFYSISLFFKSFFSILLPLIIKNIVFTYIVEYSNILPTTIYSICIKMFLWIMPIYPNIPWLISTIFDSVLIISVYLYINYTVNKELRLISKTMIKELNPRKIVIYMAIALVLLWFCTGTLYFAPYSILSNSMYPEIKVGNLVIIEKCSKDQINENDIIQFRVQNKVIVHRIVQIDYNEKGERIYITKGDNNEAVDETKIKDYNIIGKVVGNIRYLGWPSVLIDKFL